MNEQPQPINPPHRMSLGLLYAIIFGGLAVAFFLASLGSNADPIGSIIAAAFFAAIVIAIVAIVRAVKR